MAAESEAGDLNRKRVHNSEEQEASKKLKSDNFADGQQLAVRVLCEAKSVGGLIGKGGSTIKAMREESGSGIDVADSVPGARKRIVTTRGNVDAVANALHLIADKFHANKAGRRDQVEDKDPAAADEVNITILVPQCQIGGIIGKGGTKINATRDSSGASVKISEQCLGESTEKSVLMKGNSEQVYKALILICYHLLENADKAARHLYWPTSDAYGHAPEQQQQQQQQQFAFADPYGLPLMGQYGGGGGVAGNPYAAQVQQSQQQNFNSPFGQFGQAGHGGGGGGGGGGHGGGGGGGGAENVVIPIPETLIGYVIGKGGSTINGIRQQSRAAIKINDKQPGVDDRVVTITGSRQANEAAVALINEKLSQYDVSYAQ